MTVQEVLQTLNTFWADKGCMLWTPYHTEVGAGTSNPATFLRVLGPEPWSVAYMEPSIRPTDGRYGENPNRLQHYFQYQVILKPSPPNVQELFLQSLEALGLDLTKHDFRFVEDNWQSPSLGAWGLGWEAWLDGMEILQFTYFQECGGVKLDVRACELTYGIERIAMYLQGVESVYDLKWAPSGITYGDIFFNSEVEFCKYNFDAADIEKLFKLFDMAEEEGKRLLGEGLVLPAYDQCLKLSHLFNLLDARGALSVTERGRFLLRCRTIAEGCAKAFFAQREEMGHPLMRLPRLDSQPAVKPPAVDHGTFNERDTLLVEIGVEELPHGDAEAVIRQAPALMKKLLAEQNLAHGEVDLWLTPRRISLRVQDVPASQEDVTREARGPKKAAAKDADGNWTVPARKFAEANGASPDDIVFKEQGNAEYCFVQVHQKGRHIVDLMSDIVPKLILGLQFGKSMGWEDSTITFSRPVRWLVVLHGTNVIPATWKLRDASEIGPEKTIIASRTTFGHRRLGPGTVDIESPHTYLDQLRAAYVIADRDERLAMLRTKAEALAKGLGLQVEDDPDLFAEITDLGEWPEPIICTIPEEALVLPEPIIITPMKVYQRYIPLRMTNGSLSKHFLAVANGEHSEEGRRIIGVGNERVLNARLRDARYFWDTDTRSSLNEFAKKLTRVMFHQDLGTVADKVERLKKLYTRVEAALPKVDGLAIDQVLTLMKADLTTQMVGEFDSLEGVMGMLYARKEGIDEAVARAIFEHRLPRRAGDEMPSTPLGIAAGLLDRFDSLAGYFGLGIRVKGTSDPFGLRRNALAVLAVIEAAELDVDIRAFAEEALANYGGVIEDKAGALQALTAFFADRQEVMMRDEGFPYDIVTACLGRHAARPMQLVRCVRALTALDEGQRQELAEQAKRIKRILKDPANGIDSALLDAQEKELYSLLDGPQKKVESSATEGAFDKALAELVAWTPVISSYFDSVLVNDKNDAIRQNRHALIRDVLNAMNAVADFTAIEKKETV